MTPQRSRRILCVLCLVLLVPALAFAATDPDIDPAEELEIDAQVEGVDLAIHQAQAWFQTSIDGVEYVRVDLEIENLSAEPHMPHAWHFDIGGVTVTANVSAVIAPGATKTVSQLVLGSKIQTIAGQKPSVSVTLGGTFSPTCGYVVSYPQCAMQAAQMQGLCNAKCIGQGAASGVVSCQLHSFKSGSVQCYTYHPICTCQGRQTVSEDLFEGLFDPEDPLTQDVVTYPPLIEVREHELPFP